MTEEDRIVQVTSLVELLSFHIIHLLAPHASNGNRCMKPVLRTSSLSYWLCFPGMGTCFLLQFISKTSHQ